MQSMIPLYTCVHVKSCYSIPVTIRIRMHAIFPLFDLRLNAAKQQIYSMHHVRKFHFHVSNR